MAVPFEVVLVNDDSRDDSWSVIEAEAAVRPWLRGIDLSRNFGQHNALLCGIRAARHEIIVTMDDDLQNPPEGGACTRRRARTRGGRRVWIAGARTART